MARVNVTIPDEMKAWVDDQPELNVSGLLQKQIEQQMRDTFVLEFRVTESGSLELKSPIQLDPGIDIIGVKDGLLIRVHDEDEYEYEEISAEDIIDELSEGSNQ